jgi:hypothetical protein
LSDHLTQTQIENYGRRPLPAAEWLFVSDHLSVCEKCRLKLEATVDDEAVYLALKSGAFDGAEARLSITGRAHLTFEQMTGLIEGKASAEDLQSASDHLAWCQDCEAAVDDLRDFKDQVAAELERENRKSPAGVAAKSRWLRLFPAIHSFWPKSSMFVYGSALAALLLASAAWLGWRALQGIKSTSKLAVTIPSTGVSPSVSPGPRSTPGAEDASMVIARLNDGQGQVTLDREGKLSGVDHLPFAYQQMIRRALTDQELETSRLLAGLNPSGGAPRGAGTATQAGLSVVEPVGVVTLSDRPTFRWSRLDGSTSYVVEVYDELFILAAASPQITGLSWTATKSLRRGGIYYWQVKAAKDGREFKAPSRGAPQAKFRILDAAGAYELAQARRAYGSSRLVMGLLYAQAGLLDEAEQEFRALQKANPNSELVQRLLKQARAKS